MGAMRNIEMRMRVERLLAGDFQIEHVNRLLLYIRERSLERPAVRELGHFIAHGDERNIGEVVERSKGFFAAARFHLELLGQSTLAIDDLPATTRDALIYTSEHIDKQILKRSLGIGRKRTQVALEGILSKAENRSNGRLTFVSPLSAEEVKVINLLASRLVVKPLFTQEQIARDTEYVLLKNKLLCEAEIGAFRHHSPRLALVALYLMHGCMLKLGPKDDTAELIITASDGVLAVFVTAQTPSSKAPNLSFSVPLFTTALRVADFCDHDLIKTSLPWNFPLAIGNDGKLKLL